jgi:cell wall-associated NlpC family hydrolase
MLKSRTIFFSYFVVMKKSFRNLLVVILVLISAQSFAQVPEFDRLEMLYAQQHYKLVYRKANRLLDQPDYDFSQIPTFYKSLSLFQLAQNKHWLLRKPGAMKEAGELFAQVRKSADGYKVLTAHMYEVSALKKDLVAYAEDLKRTGEKEKFEELNKIMLSMFDDIKEIDTDGMNNNQQKPSQSPASTPEREELVAYAKQYLGVPYVWAGDDPKGFDCSGFTSFVYRKAGKELPRRAVDQCDGSRKLKEKTVEKGDLIFFDNGSGISHVGMIISDKGESLVMIHASSSKGIVITDIESSDYWMKRIAGFGTYLD